MPTERIAPNSQPFQVMSAGQSLIGCIYFREESCAQCIRQLYKETRRNDFTDFVWRQQVQPNVDLVPRRNELYSTSSTYAVATELRI